MKKVNCAIQWFMVNIPLQTRDCSEWKVGMKKCSNVLVGNPSFHTISKTKK
jgi:hypothetical protein